MNTQAFAAGLVFILAFLFVGFLVARSVRDPATTEHRSRRPSKHARHLDPLPEPLTVSQVAEIEAEELGLYSIQTSEGLPLATVLKTWHRDATTDMKAADRSQLRWQVADNVAPSETTEETLRLQWVATPLKEDQPLEEDQTDGESNSDRANGE